MLGPETGILAMRTESDRDVLKALSSLLNERAILRVLKGRQIKDAIGEGGMKGGVLKRTGATFESVDRCTPTKMVVDDAIESPKSGK